MSSTFLDGPAAGVTLWIRRAPILLRVVHSASTGWDALDQPGDSPRQNEVIFVYILTGKPGWMHLCVRGKNKKEGGFWPTAEYKLLEPQPPAEVLWFNEDWCRWCDENKDKLMPEWAKGESTP